MLYYFVIVIHIIASLVLILVILMQAGRGSGMSDVFGGSSTRTIFGTSASNFLMKATAVSAAVFIFTCMTLAILSSERSRSLMESRKALSAETEKPKTPPPAAAEKAPVNNEKEPVSPQPKQ